MHEEDYARNTRILSGGKSFWDPLTPGFKSSRLQIYVNHYEAALVLRELFGFTLEDLFGSFIGKWHARDQLAIRSSGFDNRARHRHASATVPDQSWDYGSGKVNIPNNNRPLFAPDPKNIQIDSSLKEKFQNAHIEKRYLSDIRDSWIGAKPSHALNVLIGPFASGSFVVNNQSILDLVKSHSRKLIGVDMEAYGVFYAANNCCSPKPIPFSIKSISDFGINKADDYQHYAAYVSAQYLYHFAVDELAT